MRQKFFILFFLIFSISQHSHADLTQLTSPGLVGNSPIKEAIRLNPYLRLTEALPYAELVDAGYKFQIENVHGFRRLEKDELPSDWQPLFIPHKPDAKYPNGKGMLINDPESSMWAMVLESLDDRQIVLVLRGTELRPSFFTDMTTNLATVVKNWIGKGIPRHFKQAYSLAHSLREKYPDKELVVTGSSLGGSLAMFAGLSVDARVYAFNTLGLNQKEIDFIDTQNAQATHKAPHDVLIVNVEGDSIAGKFDQYMGTQIVVPFYDSSLTGYYTSIHHTSDAIVKSIEAYLKREALTFSKTEAIEAVSPNLAELNKELENDEVQIINQTGMPVKFIAFSCTYSAALGTSATYCDESMFHYPHKEFTTSETLGVMSAKSKIPFLSMNLSNRPVTIKELEPSRNSHVVLRLQRPAPMWWPATNFVKGQWVYVTAMTADEKCVVGKIEPIIHLGQPTYKGLWPTSWLSGSAEGWLNGDNTGNPKALVITKGHDACSLQITGF